MDGDRLAALVAAAQGGEGAALEALFQRAARLAYARARKVTSRDDRAEDAAQEALLAAYRALPRLKDPHAFLPWLRTIVDHAVAAQHEREARRREEPLSVADDLPAPDRGPAAAEQHLMLAQVQRALAALPSRDQVVVELFYFEDLSCRQVAEFLYLTLEAVKMILHRARVRLRKELTTMSADVTEKGTPRIVHSMKEVDPHARRQDLMFEHESRTARVYLSLYPAGEAGPVAKALGLGRAEMETELAWLAERRLIVEEGGRWRCLMPVMLDRDQAIIRPWAEQAAAPILARLDDLHEKLLALAGGRPEDPRTQTILAVGLHFVTAGRSFRGLIEKLSSASPDHGEWGKSAVAAAAGREGWPEGYSGHMQSSESRSEEEGTHYFYLLWPQGTDRRAVVSLLESVGEEIETLDAQRGLLRFLISVGRSPIPRSEAAGLAAESGVRATDLDGLLSELVRLGALREEEGQLTLATPHVEMQEWQGFIGKVDAIGAEVVRAVTEGADDLRARLVRCSFADCDYAESVYLCFSLAAGLVSEAIRQRRWVEFPEQADFGWGVLLVT